MTGGVSSNSLTLTIRLSSSARFEIGSCGTITPNSTIQQVKQIISQREESGNCAVERQRLIFKGRILSENTRTLADYGISSEDVSSGIVLYLVKGGAASGSGGGNAGASTTSSAPSPALMCSVLPPLSSHLLPSVLLSILLGLYLSGSVVALSWVRHFCLCPLSDLWCLLSEHSFTTRSSSFHF